ncbi:MAG: VOC family protein [Thermoplasmata archaeon]|nr:VOC family protein [Thermoplasmata archaeon]
MSSRFRARLAHVNVEVSDLRRAARYYDRFLPLLGLLRRPTGSSRWLCYQGAGTTLWLTESRPRRVTRRPARAPKTEQDDPISEHLAFRVPSGRRVELLAAELESRGYRAVYPVEWQASQGGRWYVSTAWADPDGVVIEVYALPRRTGRRTSRKTAD